MVSIEAIGAPPRRRLLVGPRTKNRPILDRRIWLRRPVRWIAGVDPIIKEFRFVEIGLDFVKLQLLKVSIFFLWRNGRPIYA